MILIDELRHHGVPGMKWGVRKDRKRSGRSSKSHKKRQWIADEQIAKGRKFVKDNAGSLIVAGISAAAIASGHAYLGPFITMAGNGVVSNIKRD